MENVWDKLKSVKGRSWLDTKNIIKKTSKEISQTNEVIRKYNVSSETLPEKDREIYGLHLKSEPFFLERCKTCFRLLKFCVLEYHNGSCCKKNTAATKKTTFISPNKKKSTKRSNKSTSEDDSESVISSENSSPALDLQESQTNDSTVTLIRDDSMIDVISVEEIPSEDSKPPTPGPQDLYEEFATPYLEETSNSFSSTLESSDSSKFKPGLKLKIVSNKDTNQKSHTTSLLEAHLLSNTKYNTISNVDVQQRNSNYKLAHQTSLLEQAILKSDDVTTDQTETWKSINSPKLKTDTKISIPISVLPQNVKVAGTVKKSNVVTKMALSKTNLQRLVESKDRNDCGQPASPYVAESENSIELSSSDYSKEKSSTRSKKNKRSKGKNRSSKNTDFDPNKHCGVLLDENRHCMRSLTCKTHSISLRRAVEGRSKEFDRLLAEHRASKEALKDPDRQQNLHIGDPIISIPFLAVDKISGNTIQVPSSNKEPEMIRVRVSNLLSHNLENSRSQPMDSDSTASESEKFGKKLFPGPKSAAVSNPKLTGLVSRTAANSNSLSSTNSHSTGNIAESKEIKLKLNDDNLKVSFVCSDMLYKVGGLLYTDRSRQAIRNCMIPLTSNGAVQKGSFIKQSQPSQKITDFLQLIKNSSNPPIKLSLLKEQNNAEAAKSTTNLAWEGESKFKSSDEIERMKNLLTNSKKVLNTLSTDENELRALRLTRLKRPADKSKNCNGKRIKQECMDENYDINALLSFDKSLLNKIGNSVQFTAVSADDFVCPPFRTVSNNGVGRENVKFVNQQLQHSSNNMQTNMVSGLGFDVVDSLGVVSHNSENTIGFQKNGSTQLWQTFKDLESEIRNTIGTSNIQELYTSQALPSEVNETFPPEYVSTDLLASDAAFQENGEPDIEETISKNYSLLEEYCKNIPTDELLDGKGNYEFYENSLSQVNDVDVKLNENAATVINSVGSEHMYTNVTNAIVNDGNSMNVATDGLSFDAQVLSSYLSSVSSENPSTAQSINVNDMNFVTDQFNVVHMETTPIQRQVLGKEHIYEEILTLNTQFPSEY